jgi:hypothetical protein
LTRRGNTARLHRVGKLAGRVEYLLSEMRRRRVFRVLAGYLALSFALLQLADLVYPVIGRRSGRSPPRSR